MITPYTRFCKNTVAANAAAIHAIVRESGKVWVPQLCRSIPQDILQVILQFTQHASCGRIQDAEHLIAAGFQSILITLPIVNRDTLSRVLSLANQGHLTVVIDHFVHAEMLSRAVAGSSVSVDVLIDVDLGRQVTGVRPGPDSALLAAAVVRLPNIRLRGVYVDDRGCKSSTNAESMPLSFEQSIGVAIHCQRIIEGVEIACSEVFSGFEHQTAAASSSAVTSVLASPLTTNLVSANETSDPTDRNHVPAVELVCSVISRPSLEWCVIDAGRLMWGDSHQLQVQHPSGARLLHALPEISTLLLSGDSLDLRIGEEVVLTHIGFAERLSMEYHFICR